MITYYLVIRLGGNAHSIHLNIMALTLGVFELRDEKSLTMWEHSQGFLSLRRSTHRIWTLIFWLIEWLLHHSLNAELMLNLQNIAITSKIGGYWWITFVAITLAVAGLRSSYSDSGALSPIPFRNMPFQTQQTKKFGWPQTDSILCIIYYII